MVVIVASLFLPFQPQFEITTTKSEVEALAKSKLVKTPISRHNPADAGSNAPLRTKAMSSSHSVTSPYLMAVDHNPATGEEPTALGSTTADGAKAWGAFPVISSQLFMENLTSNASSSAIGTPANPVYHHGNTSVEEFFAAGSTAKNQDSEGASDVYSTVSSPSGELANGGLTGSYDPTANLLKGVNKSLLYHSVLTGNASATALDTTKSVPNTNTHSTVITPRSKQLLEVNSSVSNISKIKPQPIAAPGLRWVNHKASGIVPSGVNSSNLKYPVQATNDDSVELDGDETRKASKQSSSTRLGDLADTDEVDDYTFEDIGNNKSTKDRADIPKFGGYSNDVKTRAQLLGGSYNVFATAPWKVLPSSKGNGGLRNALGTALLEKTIEHPVLWVGTLGIPTDAIPKNVLTSITDTFKSEYCSYPVVTDDITFKGAYKNFCKQILWPTLNYQIPDNPNSKAFEDHSWNYYQYLNQQFADKIVEAYKEGDTIWVHDYHLMLVPGMIRKAIPNAKIGFFLHVSFPSSEVFRCFAQREKILEGILGANSLGFQTEEYARHFQQTANRLLMTDVDTHLLKYKGRLIAVESIPIGVDAFDLEAQIRSDSTTQWRKLIRERWSGKKLIVSRDQFDRIRGLCKKMLAYERFLKDNPHYIDQVVLIQICLGSGNDLVLERELMTVVDRINAMSKDISVSQPVVFLHQDLQFPQYLALGCEADLFLVSTMREGMNLTCHEFIVCSQAKNAPLLLSEFTGSAHVLNKGCFLINPWDIRQVSEVIKKGLELSKEEKRRRWKTLYKSVITHDSDRWVLSSLSSIANSWEANHERSKVYNLSFSKIQEDYMDSRKHLFVLKISEPLNPRMLAALTDLCSKNIVFVINSFSRPMLERLYNRVPNLGLIAENGAYVRISGHWYHLAEDVSWKEDIIKVFEDKVERLPGSYYKLGETMIRFHTENAEDRERVSSVIGDAITHVNTLYGDKGIHAYIHQNIVFVQQAGLSVKAIRLILNHYNSSGETPNSAPLDTPLGSPRQSPDVHQVLSSPSTSESKTSSNPVATYFNKGRSSNKVEFLSISGSSSPIIEPLFRFVNESTKRGEVAHGYTIAYGDSITTYAKQHIEGLNELFGILDKLTKL